MPGSSISARLRPEARVGGRASLGVLELVTAWPAWAGIYDRERRESIRLSIGPPGGPAQLAFAADNRAGWPQALGQGWWLSIIAAPPVAVKPDIEVPPTRSRRSPICAGNCDQAAAWCSPAGAH